MQLLVTGGAGFVGSHYVRRVLADAWGLRPPARVTVLDKHTYAADPTSLAGLAGDPRLRVVHGDVADPAAVRPLVAEADAVLHLAAESHVDRSIASPALFVTTNVVGTQVVLDAAREHRTRVVHVSTDEVYGSIETGSWDEDAPLRPSSPYSASKAAADLLALAYHRTYGLPVSITRGCNTYGPGQHPEKVVPRFVTTLLAGGLVPVYGDGRHEREWLHVDDHARALHLVLLGGRAGAVYHVGGGTPLTNLALADRLLGLLGLVGLRGSGAGGADRVEHVADRPGHDRRYSLDASRIREELGWVPQVDFEDGLAGTVEALRARA